MNPSRFSNQLLRIATRLFPSSRRSHRDSLSSQSSTDSQTSQQISAWDIDPKKLADHLTSAFEPNSFQIDVNITIASNIYKDPGTNLVMFSWSTTTTSS